MPRMKIFIDGKPHWRDLQTGAVTPCSADVINEQPLPLSDFAAADEKMLEAVVQEPARGKKDAGVRVENAPLTPEQRGQIIFRYLAGLAQKGRPTGVGYADFWAVTHGKATFQEAERRAYENIGDTQRVLKLAYRVTELNGRIPVSRHGATIESGMDSYIWNRQAERPDGAFGATTYHKSDWLLVFPNGLRRLISPNELLRIIDGGSDAVSTAATKSVSPVPAPSRDDNNRLPSVAPSKSDETDNWETNDNDDVGSLYTGSNKLWVGAKVKIEGEGKIRTVTYVMGSDRKGWRACFKGQGMVPTGEVLWRCTSSQN